MKRGAIRPLASFWISVPRPSVIPGHQAHVAGLEARADRPAGGRLRGNPVRRGLANLADRPGSPEDHRGPGCPEDRPGSPEDRRRRADPAGRAYHPRAASVRFPVACRAGVRRGRRDRAASHDASAQLHGGVLRAAVEVRAARPMSRRGSAAVGAAAQVVPLAGRPAGPARRGRGWPDLVVLRPGPAALQPPALVPSLPEQRGGLSRVPRGAAGHPHCRPGPFRARCPCGRVPAPSPPGHGLAPPARVPVRPARVPPAPGRAEGPAVRCCGRGPDPGPGPMPARRPGRARRHSILPPGRALSTGPATSLS
jgi:hypothetical protein